VNKDHPVPLDSKETPVQSDKVVNLESPVKLDLLVTPVFLVQMVLVENEVSPANEDQLVLWANPAHAACPVFLVTMVPRVPKVKRVHLAPQVLKVSWVIPVTEDNKDPKVLLVNEETKVSLVHLVQRV